MAIERACSGCRFFEAVESQCRRMPPYRGFGWAWVRPVDWCGEWMAVGSTARLPRPGDISIPGMIQDETGKIERGK